jgi:hypothetical protein
MLRGQPVTRRARRSLTASFARRFQVSRRRSAGFSRLFFQHFVKHLLVESEIRSQALRPPVLLLGLLHLLDPARRHFGDFELSTHFGHGCPVHYLLRCQRNLLVW